MEEIIQTGETKLGSENGAVVRHPCAFPHWEVVLLLCKRMCLLVRKHPPDIPGC